MVYPNEISSLYAVQIGFVSSNEPLLDPCNAKKPVLNDVVANKIDPINNNITACYKSIMQYIKKIAKNYYIFLLPVYIIQHFILLS